MTTTPPDPGAFIRQLLGQWEQMAGGRAGGGNAQDLGRQFVERALSAANMPSRTELEDLSARIGRVEAALFRIEALLNETRKPPEASE